MDREEKNIQAEQERRVITQGEEIEKARKFFDGDRFAVENGAVIEAIGDHYARCSMKLEPKHRNAVGIVMGGAYFTLADFAFAVAANWQRVGTVSLTSNITFCGAAKGEYICAEAVCKKDGRSTCLYEINVKDELGNLAAVVSINGFHRA